MRTQRTAAALLAACALVVVAGCSSSGGKEAKEESAGSGGGVPQSTSSIEAKLQSSRDIDSVITLGAPFAAASVKAKAGADSRAEIDTFDLNADVIKQLKAGEIGFAVDQQPYLQGYLAVDELWLHKVNRNVIGGGKPVLTGPALITREDVPALEKLTAAGTR